MPADAAGSDPLPDTFGLTRVWALMEAARLFGQDPFEAMDRWSPAQAETAMQFARIHREITAREAAANHPHR